MVVMAFSQRDTLLGCVIQNVNQQMINACAVERMLPEEVIFENLAKCDTLAKIYQSLSISFPSGQLQLTNAI